LGLNLDGVIFQLQEFGVLDTDEGLVRLFQLSYPFVFACGTALFLGYIVVKGLKRWIHQIKDEQFLIGQQLHNLE
jgi:hypothetical protein